MEKLVFFDGYGKIWRGDIAEACALNILNWEGVAELDEAVDGLDDEDRCQFVEVDRPGFYVWIDLYNQFINVEDIWHWANWTDHIEQGILRSDEWAPVDLELRKSDDIELAYNNDDYTSFIHKNE